VRENVDVMHDARWLHHVDFDNLGWGYGS